MVHELYRSWYTRTIAANIGTRTIRRRTVRQRTDRQQIVHLPDSSPTKQFCDMTVRQQDNSPTGLFADRISRRRTVQRTAR